MKRPDAHRRRAAMYLAVLMVAMIVAVIGLSGLTVSRIQLRAAEGGRQVIAARLEAQSAIEMGLFSATAEANWRTAYEHDVWVAEQALGDGSITFKFVDELDGDLANDETQAARLYGKATIGEAVRIYSVLVTPPDPGPNLLTNGDVEDGTTGWVSFGDCKLETRTSGPHGGLAYLWVKQRDDYSAGPRQEISGQLTNGNTYDTEVWVRLKDFSENASLVVWFLTSGGWSSVTVATAPAGTTWTRISGAFTATWSGPLFTAYWKVQTTSSKQDFGIDDAVLVERGDSVLIPVWGTWRREVLP